MNYLLAKSEEKEFEIYQADLLWLIAKRYYSDLPQPSEVYHKKYKRDTRTAEQILEDTIKSLGGE